MHFIENHLVWIRDLPKSRDKSQKGYDHQSNLEAGLRKVFANVLLPRLLIFNEPVIF